MFEIRKKTGSVRLVPIDGKSQVFRAFFKVLCVLFVFLFVACASTPNSGTTEKKKSLANEPAWVSNPQSVYDEKQYVSATGYGLTRDLAEKSAYTSLIAVFGQRVQGETTVSERYNEALKNGRHTVSEDSELNRNITTSVDLDTVIGAEIKDTWFDGTKTFYAVAVMDKVKGAVLYANMIEKNEETIAQLTKFSAQEKNTLDAYARYDLAASIAYTNGQYLNVLSILNPSMAAAKKASVSSGDTLKLECTKIAQTIPIKVTVQNDRERRIASAFEGVISSAGFKSGGDEARYVVDSSLSLLPVELPNNDSQFVRFIVDAKLVDKFTGAILIPYNVNGREGHLNIVEAENRAVRVAQQKISTDFGKAFSDYLVQLTVKR